MLPADAIFHSKIQQIVLLYNIHTESYNVSKTLGLALNKEEIITYTARIFSTFKKKKRELISLLRCTLVFMIIGEAEIMWD